MVDLGTTNNAVLGNAIGTNGSGTLSAGNGDNGMWIGGGAMSNTIDGNIIANMQETA